MRKISCIEFLLETGTVDTDGLVCVYSLAERTLPYHQKEMLLALQIILMPIKSFYLVHKYAHPSGSWLQ